MDRVAFSIFGFDIYWYAITIVSGMIIAIITASMLIKRRGYNPDVIIDFAICVLPLAIIFARLYYVVSTLDRNWTFREILNTRSGGLAIYGGIIGGALGVLIVGFIKKYRLKNFLDITDAIVPGLIIAQALGRWGNFFNQEAYGGLVDNPGLQFFPYAVFIEAQNAWFQATFFYESFFNMIGFVLLLLLTKKLNGKYRGLVTSAYLGYYGIVRVVVEGFRSDSLYWGTVRASQLLSALLIVAALVFAYLIIKKGFGQGELENKEALASASGQKPAQNANLTDTNSDNAAKTKPGAGVKAGTAASAKSNAASGLKGSTGSGGKNKADSGTKSNTGKSLGKRK